jgi:hypothetical protein
MESLDVIVVSICSPSEMVIEPSLYLTLHRLSRLPSLSGQIAMMQEVPT